MVQDSLYSLIHDRYGVDVSEKDYKRLTDTLDMYNVNPASVSIDIQSHFDSFVNNMHLTKNIKFQRNHTEIELEDVIYQMIPTLYGSQESIETKYPKTLTRQITANVPKDIDHQTQNIAVIRTLSIRLSDESVVNERYTIMVLNEKVDIRAGIIFEKIS